MSVKSCYVVRSQLFITLFLCFKARAMKKFSRNYINIKSYSQLSGGIALTIIIVISFICYFVKKVKSTRNYYQNKIELEAGEHLIKTFKEKYIEKYIEKLLVSRSKTCLKISTVYSICNIKSVFALKFY